MSPPELSAGPSPPHEVASGRDATTSVSVILPTYNEAESIRAVVAATQKALRDYPDHEIVVVDDDSPDGTWKVVDSLTLQDPRIRVSRRIDRRGLASAIVDALGIARGEALVVMDADLQHDPAVIPRLLAALETAEVAVASRYSGGGSTGTWRRARRWASSLATALCRWALGLTVSDPMSGFFAIRRHSFQSIADRLRPRGFKALMEILYRLRGAPVAEVPFTFAPRLSGTSKLGREVVLDYLLALVELRTGRAVSARFLRYCLVGLSGVGVQLTALVALRLKLDEELALAFAILAAMVSNFVLNNLWTFRDRKLTDRAFGGGLVRFVVISGLGAFINHSVSLRLHQLTGLDVVWTSLGGIALATLWNYQFNRGLTWGMWDQLE